MTAAEVITAELSDPFRIVLLAGLFYTMLRTRANTGIWLPLAAGAVFVAVIIATILQEASVLPLWQRVFYGLISNVIILAVMLALWTLWQKLRTAR